MTALTALGVLVLALAAAAPAALWWHERAQARREARRAMVEGFTTGLTAGEECVNLARRYAREVHGARGHE